MKMAHRANGVHRRIFDRTAKLLDMR